MQQKIAEHTFSKLLLYKDLTLRIGDISISIEGAREKIALEVTPSYRSFIRPGKADIRLHLHRGLPETPRGEKVFECPPIWTLYRQQDTSMIEIFHDLSDLKRTLVFSSNLEKTDLYLSEDSALPLDPLYGPTMELLMVNYLAKGKGAIIHSCGISRNGRGTLFVGDSGAGKSTLARMWDREDSVEVLSDDRTILRKKGNEFWMYGTPWHGEAAFASPQGIRLDRVFFLKHGRENSIREVNEIAAVSQLLACSFSPLWDREGMAFVLDFITELIDQVPVQELSFTPEKGVLEFVNRIAK
ncbi:MAG: hypothetical protein JJE15_11020 [Desulfobacteraceae bacterium]|nr:hypothetical protein [Desulfobacteraceae bacterium]